MAAPIRSEKLQFPLKAEILSHLIHKIDPMISASLKERGIFEMVADAFSGVVGAQSLIEMRFDLCMEGVDRVDSLFETLMKCTTVFSRANGPINWEGRQTLTTWGYETKVEFPPEESIKWYICQSDCRVKVTEEEASNIAKLFASKCGLVGEFTIKRELRTLIKGEERISELTHSLIACTSDSRCKRKLKKDEELRFPLRAQILSALTSGVGTHIGPYLVKNGILDMIADTFSGVCATRFQIKGRLDLCMEDVDIAEEVKPTLEDLFLASLMECARAFSDTNEHLSFKETRNFMFSECEIRVLFPPEANIKRYIYELECKVDLTEEEANNIATHFGSKNGLVGEFEIKRELRTLKIEGAERIAALARSLIACTSDPRTKRPPKEHI